MLEIRTRWAQPGDLAFLFSSWIRSSKRGRSSRGKTLGEHGDDLRAQLDVLLSNTSTKVRVACSPTDSAAIYGWLCWTDAPGLPLPVVHYAYTKAERRRQDVMRRLAREAGLTAASSLVYTTRSPQTKHVVAKLALAEFYPLSTFLAPPRAA